MTDREQYAKNLELALQTAAKIDRGELSRKARKLGDGYGTEEAERHCKIMFAIFEELGSTSYDYLQGDTLGQIAGAVQVAVPALRNVVESSDDAPTLRKLYAGVASNCGSLVAKTAHWLPYMSYIGGSMAGLASKREEELRKIQAQTAEAEGILEAAKAQAAEIVETARDAAAIAGTVKHAEFLETQTTELGKEAKTWFRGTAYMASFTFGLAVVAWLSPSEKDELWQTLGIRFFLLSTMLTATVWCGRIYKALKHQMAISKHRHLSLLTFQTFLKSAADPATKSAVLLEATRAVFATASTGLVGKGDDEGEPLRPIGIVNSIASNAAK